MARALLLRAVQRRRAAPLRAAAAAPGPPDRRASRRRRGARRGGGDAGAARDRGVAVTAAMAQPGDAARTPPLRAARIELIGIGGVTIGFAGIVVCGEDLPELVMFN